MDDVKKMQLMVNCHDLRTWGGTAGAVHLGSNEAFDAVRYLHRSTHIYTYLHISTILYPHIYYR